MYNTIDDRAGQLATRPNEHRPLNQLLFDTAVDLIRAGITIDPEQTRPLRTEIAVTVAAETLTGVSDRPVELAGLGTVPAGTLRDLVTGAAVRWQVIETRDPLPACGLACIPEAGYRPSRVLRRRLRSRNPVCVFPCCTAPAHHCDLDHIIPWPKGHTCEHSMIPLCRRHHELKTKGIWRLRREAGGRLIWTNPADRAVAVNIRDWPWFDPPDRLERGATTHAPPADPLKDIWHRLPIDDLPSDWPWDLAA